MGLLRLLKKAKYKFFPIKEYINGIHYNTDYSTSELDYILVINIIKGPYENSVVGFETVTNEGEGRLILKTRLIVGDYNFTSDKEWCIIASDIFQKEFESAMENYKKLREEVLNDEDDRTYRNEQYTRKVIPYLKNEYFLDKSEKLLFQETQEYILKYNLLPTTEAILISLGSRDGVFEEEYKETLALIEAIGSDTEESEENWLLETTENWCQEKAIHNGMLECIGILDNTNGKKQTKSKGSIPQILTDALGVSFDPNVGHDYMADYDDRFQSYHRKENKIPFDLDFFNRITKGGLSPKTLSIILAGTNVGKSLIMCHFAASALMQNYNVLYITLEMSEEKIASRIDANLLDTPLDTIMSLPKENYFRKIEQLKRNVKGKLIIKEYPTASAGSVHFRNLLNELKLKKQFKPDLVFIDYLNICCSSRLKMGSTINSYTYIKAIAEELRGLAQEFNIPIMSATQTTRAGYGSSDPGLDDTSESFGLPATADLMFAAVTSEELEGANQIMIKQLKNRDNDVTKYKRFMVGINRSKMKLYDIPEDQQTFFETGSSPEEIYRSVGNNLDKFKKAAINTE
jgi:archaellum biogenesis ATPase FlaH